MSWFKKWRRRWNCFHHELPSSDWQLGVDRVVSAAKPAQSWIKSQPVFQTGRKNMLWCEESLGGCGRVWFS